MNQVSVEDAKKKIRYYCEKKSRLPFFVVVDSGDEYRELKKLSGDLKPIHAGNFCAENSFPDYDALISTLNNLTDDAICFGLGEAAYLSGDDRIFRILKDKYFPRHVVIICRAVGNLIKDFARDPKFENYFCQVNSEKSFSVVHCGPEINCEVDAENFRDLLKILEDGRDGTIKVKTDLPLKNVKAIGDAYDAVIYRNPQFNLPREILNNEQWKEFLRDSTIKNSTPDNWRSYIFGLTHGFENTYLKFVADMSANFEEYAKNISLALLELNHSEKNFGDFYEMRKEILRQCEKNFSAEYIPAALTKGAEAVHYLTDNTQEEKFAAIQSLQGSAKIPETFKKNFPAFANYLSDYKFFDGRLTNYFRRYKTIKFCNVDDKNFLEEVERLAEERIYNEIETRQTLLDKLDRHAKLYWLDALGVEFCGYIQAQAAKLNLVAKIKIARADLPTLTEKNKYFYENWTGAKFDKNGKLDSLIHAIEAFNLSKTAPLYICDELFIIDEALDEIKTALENHDAEKIILTSDHGASRLAVICRRNFWRMRNPGEHGGRCCLADENDRQPPCATKENNYFVMANYDRFSGGKMHGVEVHGGAALEEILVPVIEFTLTDAQENNFVESEKFSPLKKPDNSFDFFE